jgi:DNA-3-methyladenine glycosylase II
MAVNAFCGFLVTRFGARRMLHLRAADAVLGKLIDEIGGRWAWRPTAWAIRRPLRRAGAGDCWSASRRLPRSIYGRLTARFGGRTPTPDEVLADDPEQLRVAAGLSHAKVRFLRSLAEHIVSGQLELDRLDELSDAQVVAELIAVNGLGPWSAHMFLMFQLGRPRRAGVGDLGIRRAVMVRYGLAALPTVGELEAIAAAWRP